MVRSWLLLIALVASVNGRSSSDYPLLAESRIAKSLAVFDRRSSIQHLKSSPLASIPSDSTHNQDAARKSDSSTSLVVALGCRGGDCPTDVAPFLTIGLSAMLGTILMVSFIVGTKKISTMVDLLPAVGGLKLVQWIGLVPVIFASSLFGSLVNSGLSAAASSAATEQVLNIDVVPGDMEWYNSLIKPSWNPPGWVFPIMWLIVSKPTHLIAVSRILKAAVAAPETKKKEGPNKGKAVSKGNATPLFSPKIVAILLVYCAHLSLGDAWNKVYFGLQCTGVGAVVLTTFVALLLTATYLFYTVDPVAAKFLLPTAVWGIFATALNWNIYLANK